MAFIHKKPVHAQLLKGHHIILSGLVIESGKPCFQHAAGLFHLFDGIALTALVFGLIDRRCDVIYLSLDRSCLPFPGERDALELAVADDDGVIIPCRDPAAELFPVGRLKVLFCCDKDICCRVQAKEVRAPLLRQVVGHDIEALLGEAKPF